MIWNPFDRTAGPFIAAIVFLLGFSLRSTIGPAAQATRQLSVLELAQERYMEDDEVRAARFSYGAITIIVETTVTRTPRRCTTSTSERKSPSPENSTSRCPVGFTDGLMCGFAGTLGANPGANDPTTVDDCSRFRSHKRHHSDLGGATQCH
jgi:hypothetical protein